MKALFTIFFLVLLFSASGQDKIFYNDKWNEIKSSEGAAYYEVIEYDKMDSDIVSVKYYFINGNIKYEANYSSYKNRVQEGKAKRWYSNGHLKAEEEYLKGNLNGKIISYYENGQIKRQDLYKDGDLIEGKCFALGGQKIQYSSYYIFPEFPGGMDRFMQFVATELKYPNKQRKQGVEGDVLIQFSVLEDGTVANIHVIESPNEDFSKEAVRVVRKMPKWAPGLIEDRVESFEYVLPIQFILHE